MSAKAELPGTALYFTTVLALPDSSVILGGHLVVEEDDPTLTMLLRLYKGKWNLVERRDTVVYSIAMNTADLGNQGYAALGRDGYFAICRENSVVLRESIPAHPTYLESLACIDHHFFVCGGQKRVLRREDSGWQSLDQKIVVPLNDVPSDFLLDIDGRSTDDVYVCGSEGFVGRWNGTDWETIEIPTNADLNAVHCSSSGDTFFCGGAGIVLKRAPDGSVKDLSNFAVSQMDFYDICEFKGALYLAGRDRLIKLQKDDLETVAPPTFIDELGIYSLSANDSLWCVGDENILEFSGTEWIYHECPANRPK